MLGSAVIPRVFDPEDKVHKNPVRNVEGLSYRLVFGTSFFSRSKGSFPCGKNGNFNIHLIMLCEKHCCPSQNRADVVAEQLALLLIVYTLTVPFSEFALSVFFPKCQCYVPVLEFIGHVVDRYGLRSAQSKVDAISQLLAPPNVEQLGKIGYLRHCVPKNFTQPLTTEVVCLLEDCHCIPTYHRFTLLEPVIHHTLRRQ